MTDFESGQTRQKRQRLRKKPFTEIDRAVHVERDMTDVSKVRHRVRKSADEIV
jgi:hypothetical protein